MNFWLRLGWEKVSTETAQGFPPERDALHTRPPGPAGKSFLREGQQSGGSRLSCRGAGCIWDLLQSQILSPEFSVGSSGS